MKTWILTADVEIGNRRGHFETRIIGAFTEESIEKKARASLLDPFYELRVRSFKTTEVTMDCPADWGGVK